MKAFFSSPKLAKFFAWFGGAVGTLAAAQQFGKYSALAGMGASLLSALAIHQASSTDGSSLPSPK